MDLRPDAVSTGEAEAEFGMRGKPGAGMAIGGVRTWLVVGLNTFLLLTEVAIRGELVFTDEVLVEKVEVGLLRSITEFEAGAALESAPPPLRTRTSQQSASARVELRRHSEYTSSKKSVSDLANALESMPISDEAAPGRIPSV